MSSLERTAKKIKFHPRTTVLLGENDTGKSSIIKTIYWTFGAEPARVHPEWKKLDIASLVRFSVDNKKFSLLRQGKFFALFDESDSLINKYTSVTNELGPQLAEIFNFNIKLVSKQGIEITPPPAYYLLPFYIDQDVSWTESWKAFSSLDQISHWRSPIIEYHVGLKGDEDYQLKSKKDKLSILIQGLNSERSVYDKALIEIKKEEQVVDFELDIESFKKEIEELMIKVGKLQTIEEKLKSSLVEDLNHKNGILSQINIVRHALTEATKDYDFALVQKDVECPTCGQHYMNSFAERFSIAQDEYRCKELLTELQHELIDLNKKIDKKQEQYNSNNHEIVDLNNVLSKKRGQLTLGELIRGEGRKQIKFFLKERLGSIDTKLGGYLIDMKKIEKDQKEQLKIEKEKRLKIKTTYLFRMKEYLEELNITKLLEDSYKDITCKIIETGSDAPRALLAYFYVILSLISEFSSSVFAPIIIDSPKQQDPDINNWEKVLNFIKDKRIGDAQLIFSSSDLGTVKFDGSIIKLTEKHKVLSTNEYKKVFDEINPLFNKSLIE